MSPILPPTIAPGDTIAVFTAAGNYDSEQLAPGLVYLEHRGYEVKVPVISQYRRFAGDDAARASQLNIWFADPSVKALIAARGGYGSGRILHLLDYDIIAANPKPLIGFSDITALQLAIFARTGLVTYSGMTLCADVTHDGIAPLTETTVWQALEQGTFQPATNLQILRPGQADGLLIGGCLSLICTLLGTPYLPDMAGAILFLEDTSEAPYRIDRMLNHLAMAGILQNLAGLVFGYFDECTQGEEDEDELAEVLWEYSGYVPGPVLSGLVYGHGPGKHLTPVGAYARISGSTVRIG